MFRSGCASLKFADYLNEEIGISGLSKVFSYWGQAAGTSFLPTDFVSGRIEMLEKALAADIKEHAALHGELDRFSGAWVGG